MLFVFVGGSSRFSVICICRVCVIFVLFVLVGTRVVFVLFVFLVNRVVFCICRGLKSFLCYLYL